jgi:hypothetical protein
MPTVTDRRYRMSIFLSRSDRPEVMKFHCPQCKNFLVELVGTEVTSMGDVTNLSDYQGISIRCSGSVQPGQKCHVHYVFVLGDR